VKPTESESTADTRATDGGSRVEEFSFETTTAEVEVTSGERLRTFYEEFIYKPGLVAWDDSRTRVGGIILLMYILVGTVGVWSYRAPTSNQAPRSLAPFQDASAILGSTQSGKDVLAMAIHATPPVLLSVAAGGVFATAVAVIVGTVAGYRGGAADTLLTSFSDIAMTIPGLPLIMVLAVVFRPTNPLLLGVLITINYWAGLARSIRSQVLTLRENSYIEASRAMGVSRARILYKDVIPNLMPYVLVNFANAARYVIFTAVGLYYLGILPTSVANWGIQLNDAYKQAGALVGTGALYQLVVPMVAVMGLALALILLAQGLDRVFNPRVRTRLAGESRSTADDGDDEGGVTN
jgi:peptide/nickel transport system permease protein